MTEKEYKTIENMAKYGGSFVKALAECFLKADSENFAKLKLTFIHYWTKYSYMDDEDKEEFDFSSVEEDPAGDFSGASDDDGEGR